MRTKSKTSGKVKVQLKKLENFTPEDIKNICEYGLDKYTVNEISQMLGLNKKGVIAVLNEHRITVPKKPNNIQRLYEQGKLDSDQFFIEASSLIKSRLMPDLIYKGYFRDGLRQTSYNDEDVDDCYTYVLGKIKEKYDPNKGTLATFIRTWVRGYGTTITTAQHRRYNRVGNDASLDESYNNSIREEFRDSFSFANLEEDLDKEYYKEAPVISKFLEKQLVLLKEDLFQKILKGLGEASKYEGVY